MSAGAAGADLEHMMKSDDKTNSNSKLAISLREAGGEINLETGGSAEIGSDYKEPIDIVS